MKELTHLLKKYSPEELSKKLRVARSSVYYWLTEGRPSPMAQDRIKRFFVEEQVGLGRNAD